MRLRFGNSLSWRSIERRWIIGFLRLDEAAFAQCPNISVDYAVMEKTALAAMVPVDFGWNDVGSWSALWEIAPHDEQGNYVSRGEAILEDAAGCYVHSEKALVSALGSKISLSSTRPMRCSSPTNRARRTFQKSCRG